MQPIALFYDQAGYTESTSVRRAPTAGPAGLMGRQVAGREFLDAYLKFGSWTELIALTSGAEAQSTLQDFCIQHPSSRQRQRRLKSIAAADFQTQFLPHPPASVLHFPNPPDPSYAWARQRVPHRLAYSGVTHTLCSRRAVEVLRGLVTDPWEDYDRLICTSRAVRDMVSAVTQTYADYLQDRFGGKPEPRIQLETIPLGVNTRRFQPASPEQRSTARQQLQLRQDEIAVLFVGRLSHHAKAHPFPMFRAASEAAARSGKTLRLLMCGWAPSAAVADAFRGAAQAISPNVRVDFVDGMDPQLRVNVWQAADIFMSLVDNIQETFGLVIVEAMASGLPVIASDWNGYRDLVVDQSTGFLIPTLAMPQALPDLTSQLLTGAINYDHFLARTSQTVHVSSQAAADALTTLCNDAGLRRQLGAAGRQRAERLFDWQHVIGQYESMWQQQQTQLEELNDRRQNTDSPRRLVRTPAAYPTLETTFAGYPTGWISDEQFFVRAADAEARLQQLLSLPLVTHEAETRCDDINILQKILSRTSRPTTLRRVLLDCEACLPDVQRRSTLAWLIKYDLLIPVDAAD